MQVHPWLPVDNDEESDSAAAHADEAPLAGSRMRAYTVTGLANVDTQRRSRVVSALRRSLKSNEYLTNAVVHYSCISSVYIVCDMTECFGGEHFCPSARMYERVQ